MTENKVSAGSDPADASPGPDDVARPGDVAHTSDTSDGGDPRDTPDQGVDTSPGGGDDQTSYAGQTASPNQASLGDETGKGDQAGLGDQEPGQEGSSLFTDESAGQDAPGDFVMPFDVAVGLTGGDPGQGLDGDGTAADLSSAAADYADSAAADYADSAQEQVEYAQDATDAGDLGLAQADLGEAAFLEGLAGDLAGTAIEASSGDPQDYSVSLSSVSLVSEGVAYEYEPSDGEVGVVADVIDSSFVALDPPPALEWGYDQPGGGSYDEGGGYAPDDSGGYEAPVEAPAEPPPLVETGGGGDDGW
jgi:hypothetical protein